MKVIDKARELLLRQEVAAFSPEIQRMNFGEDKRIYFDTFEGYAKATGTRTISRREIKDGCTIIKGDIYIILVHERLTAASRESLRSRWTLAHEIAHVFLGHRQDGEEEERQADRFASELLVPELILLELRKRLNRNLTVDEVSRLFGVSHNAAAVRLNHVFRRDFFSVYLKCELLQKYERIIQDYVKNARRKQSLLVYVR
ncbi:MAG: ImmA/IrrE family metallo-endopeptidase [Oscillospiraceae bacterium]|nr:ImmA/IrrE family metallo-endopeptidase [Oscillospiraceae bacterium]